MAELPDVDLVVNCYERTYRQVLRPGFFDGIEAQNRRALIRHVIINNVDNRSNAEKLARRLFDEGEIASFDFVADRLAEAQRVCGIPNRLLRRRPYFLNYALVMTITGSAPWLLGWDAEVELGEPTNWIDPAIELLQRRPDIYSASCRWPARAFDTFDSDTVAADGVWRLNWGFSDQMFLVRRADVALPIYRRFAPAANAHNFYYPWTFEARMEAYQRATRRYRATHSALRYSHNDLVRGPQSRRGLDLIQFKLLRRLNAAMQHRPSGDPRWTYP